MSTPLDKYRSLEEAWSELADTLVPDDPANRAFRETFFAGAMIAFMLITGDKDVAANCTRDLRAYSRTLVARMGDKT